MDNKIIQQELPYDGLTPIMAYQALGGKGCCILESAYEKGAGKTSHIGIHPIGHFVATGRHIEIVLNGEKHTFREDPYKALQQFAQGRRIFGFITYDAIRSKECIPNRHPSKELPEFFFRFYQTTITFYHDRQKVICTHTGNQQDLENIVSCCQEPSRLKSFKSPAKLHFTPDISNATFVKMVDTAKEYIRAGDIFQVVLSRTFHAHTRSTPFEIYRALRQTSPSPYHFFFEENDFAIAGASPELLVSIQDGHIESMPIAGTRPKESPPESLLHDPKECAEHVMLVDLARNDVGAIAVPGSVRVPEYKTVKSFSHVHHLVSRVTGLLPPSTHPLEAFKASFPAGTLSGAPKIRAMEIIDELETSQRDLYGGAIATLDEQGNLMSCIAIRTAFIKGNNVEIRVGAGIVLDSDPIKETQETEHKARGVMAALELAEGAIP